MEPFAVLERAGRLLYGEHWRQDLPATIDISPTTLRHMATGRMRLAGNHGIFRDVDRLLADQAREIDEVRRAIADLAGSTHP